MIAISSRNIFALATACLVFATGPVSAQDKIFLKSGEVLDGEVKSYNLDKQAVTVKSSIGEIPYPLANISKIELSERPELAQAKAALKAGQFQKAVELSQPLSDRFLGVDEGWVAEAAGTLADAQSALGKTGEAAKLYEKIMEVYPNSIYRLKGKIGQAKTLIASGNAAGALLALDEVEKAVEPAVVPDATTMQILSDVYLERGKAYEKTQKLPEALECYLKVATIYYLPADRAAAAEKLAQELTAKNKSVVVN